MTNRVEIQYHFDDNSFIGEAISFTITLINHSNIELFLLKKGTPFANTLTDCFEVKYNNEQKVIIFDGLFIKAGQICESDIVSIKPNAPPISKKVLISDSYQVSRIGNYELKLKLPKLFISSNKSDLLNAAKRNTTDLIEITNPIFKFTIPNKIKKIKTIGEKNRRKKSNKSLGGIIFLNGTPAQKQIILDSTKLIIKKSVSFNLFSVTDSRFLKWFGVHNQAEFDQLKKRFILIFKKIKTDYIKYYFYSEGEYMDEPCDYASTSKCGDMINIYSSLFWSAGDDFSFNSKPGTIIHEFSHIYCDTDDDGGESITECRNCADNYPEVAIRCANNYELYVEELW